MKPIEKQENPKDTVYTLIEQFLTKNLHDLGCKKIINLERAIVNTSGQLVTQDFFQGTHKNMNEIGERGYVIKFENKEGEIKTLLFMQNKIKTELSSIDYIYSLESIARILDKQGLTEFGIMMERIKKLDVPQSKDAIAKAFEAQVENIITL